MAATTRAARARCHSATHYKASNGLSLGIINCDQSTVNEARPGQLKPSVRTEFEMDGRVQNEIIENKCVRDWRARGGRF
jgi:hypothetical protein